MARPLRIFVMGVNHPVPTFIRRRLSRLDAAGIHLVVACHRKTDFIDFKNAELIEFDRVSVRSPFRLLLQLVRFILLFPANVQLLRLAPQPAFMSRLKWSVEVIQLVRVRNVDLIHLQWLVPKERYLWLSHFYKGVPIMISVRGSQVTVNAGKGREDFITENFKHASALHCVSHDIARHCHKLGADDNSVFVNCNGINLQKFIPPATPIASSGKFNLVSVGSLIWRKGYLFQLLIVKELTERGLGVHLTIVGSGIEDRGLQYMVQRLGLESVVLFAGQLKESEIIQKLCASDLYLSTSVAEGLPNSLVEAAACGLPIVSFECEGAREVIDDGRTGFVVSYGQVREAADKITLLMQDAKLRSEMAKGSRRKMELEFNENEWVDKMISVYHKLAARKSVL